MKQQQRPSPESPEAEGQTKPMDKHQQVQREHQQLVLMPSTSAPGSSWKRDGPSPQNKHGKRSPVISVSALSHSMDTTLSRVFDRRTHTRKLTCITSVQVQDNERGVQNVQEVRCVVDPSASLDMVRILPKKSKSIDGGKPSSVNRNLPKVNVHRSKNAVEINWRLQGKRPSSCNLERQLRAKDAAIEREFLEREQKVREEYCELAMGLNPWLNAVVGSNSNIADHEDLQQPDPELAEEVSASELAPWGSSSSSLEFVYGDLEGIIHMSQRASVDPNCTRHDAQYYNRKFMLRLSNISLLTIPTTVLRNLGTPLTTFHPYHLFTASAGLNNVRKYAELCEDFHSMVELSSRDMAKVEVNRKKDDKIRFYHKKVIDRSSSVPRAKSDLPPHPIYNV